MSRIASRAVPAIIATASLGYMLYDYWLSPPHSATATEGQFLIVGYSIEWLAAVAGLLLACGVVVWRRIRE